MNRRFAKIISGVLLGVFLLLTLIATVTRSDALFNVAIVALIGMAFVELTYDRCPHCQAYVGRSGGSYCPKCGKGLDDA